jgi:hypothetical protein
VELDEPKIVLFVKNILDSNFLVGKAQQPGQRFGGYRREACRPIHSPFDTQGEEA